VTFTVDLRAMADRARQDAVAQFERNARDIATARGLKVDIELFHDVATAPCAADLQRLLAEAVADLGHKPVQLPSGAGHDAQIMTRLCPSAMLFVRCRAGISHNPAEYASPADMGKAVAALIRFIERLAHRPGTS
jgi:allantoate deiminase